MYSIRYLIKKDGSQIAFWDRSVSLSPFEAMHLADTFASATKSKTIMESDWEIVFDKENFWRKKIVFAAGSSEETNFALHINVGLESESHKSNL